MSTAIIPLDFESHAVRSLMIDGQPWFVAADVCRVLKHSNLRMAIKRWLDDDEKGVTVCYTLGGEQEMTIVSESGLYALIIHSKTPAARRFHKWVTAEVIPALLRDGTYSLSDRQQLGAKRAHYAALPGKVQDRAGQRREAVEFINAAIADGARIGDAAAEAAEKFGV